MKTLSSRFTLKNIELQKLHTSKNKAPLPVNNVISDREQYVKLSITYLDTGSECFSQWQKDELKTLSAFINKISKIKLHELSRYDGLGLDSSGENFNKTIRKYMKAKFISQVSVNIIDEINIKHMRINKRSRVHGYFDREVFNIIRLDRNHDIN